ncbi:hypothetical protein PYW07_015665 [Mythimna separata]|uniref:Zinc finger DNA binding protein n=1 Tax=Mythimna separata TaxID=271217 RepID=A0AAD8DZ74_MYTSE|nr:hypothetical protein PYW07_015665 [Mythimna separata]
MQRTPPKSPAKAKKGQSPAISSHQSKTENTEDVNITVRSNKRRLNTPPGKLDDSPSKQVNTQPVSCTCMDLKHELLEMLTSWKIDHDNRLTMWKAEQNAMLSSLSKDVSELKVQCEEIRKTSIELDKGMTFINKSYEDLLKRVVNLEEKKVENIESVERIEKQIQDLQLHSRSATVELRNVPTKDNERTEDLVTIMSGVGKAVDLEILESHFRDIHRLPGKPGLPRSIVAEFTSVSRKHEFLSNVRRYNKERTTMDKLNTHTIGLPGDKKPIYASEHLTASMRKLFYECRQFAKTHKLSCWSLNGKIFMRRNPEDKPTQIKSERCMSVFSNTV